MTIAIRLADNASKYLLVIVRIQIESRDGLFRPDGDLDDVRFVIIKTFIKNFCHSLVLALHLIVIIVQIDLD